jgi:hypothetical protein
MNEPSARQLMRSLTADLPVASAPMESTMAAGRRLRRRRRNVSVFVAVAVTAGTLFSAGLVLRTDEPRESIAPVNTPPSHTWWAEGALHMSGATVPLLDVRALVQIPGGVVVLTGLGEVRRVDQDGTDELIGRWRTGAALDDLQPNVRAQDDGKVVWLDGTRRPEHSFVVYDPATGDRVASHAIPTGGFFDAAWLNDFEDGVVYWDTRAGQRAWDIASDKVTKIGSGATFLVALENGVWVTNNDTGDGIEIASSGRQLWASTDSGGWFSPDGATVVTLSGPPPQLRARTALTGRQIAEAIDMPTATGPVSVYLGDDRKLAYVVGTEDSGVITAPYDLVSCDLTNSRCTTIVDDATEQPVLPSD